LQLELALRALAARRQQRRGIEPLFSCSTASAMAERDIERRPAFSQ